MTPTMAEAAFRAAFPVIGGLDAAVLDAAAVEISGWPDYAPSPLVALPGLARRLGVGAVLVKDEGQRFGLGGVKVLGAPYGLTRLLQRRGVRPGSAACAGLTAIAATDGNHGLALAWAARRLGCAARIFVGQAVDPPRIARIQACGAVVETVPGTYDDAVRAAEEAAANDPSLLLITDTDHVGGLAVTTDIVAGYALLGREAWQQMNGALPTHVFLQCGVGGVAAGVAAGLWQQAGTPPAVITVEPEQAACVQASLRTGRLTSVPGDLDTRMVGLACGQPSAPALAVLRAVTRHALTVPEDTAVILQHELATGAFGDAPLVGGDTGVAGLAGLWWAATQPDLRARLGLGADSRVLTILSEGPLPRPTG